MWRRDHRSDWACSDCVARRVTRRVTRRMNKGMDEAMDEGINEVRQVWEAVILEETWKVLEHQELMTKVTFQVKKEQYLHKICQLSLYQEQRSLQELIS